MNELYEMRLYALVFPYSKYLEAISHSFETITKPLKYKIGEAFCEGFKSMFKLFRMDG